MGRNGDLQQCYVCVHLTRGGAVGRERIGLCFGKERGVHSLCRVDCCEKVEDTGTMEEKPLKKGSKAQNNNKNNNHQRRRLSFRCFTTILFWGGFSFSLRATHTCIARLQFYSLSI